LLSCAEILKFHIPSFALMSPRNGPPDKSNRNRTAKVLAAVPITGILAAAALLSGFSSVIGSETAIAQQQNMTGTNATAANATAANATGNQTATSSNQTGAAATSGGSNNAGTAGSYYP
jgi:predicted amino acid dehydrogenase